jgi:DNA polymerase-3 subunit epsilon
MFEVFQYLRLMNYVIIDVETTGGSPKTTKITEIALYKFDGQSIVDEFVTLINPEEKIPDFIVKLTGISDRMVSDAPKFYEIAKKIVEFCKDCIFVAHNVSFDYNVIRGEFKRLGFDFRFPQLCTVRASRLIFPGYESYSLGKITRELGIQINGRHRAGGDALATAHLFQMMHIKDGKKLIDLVQHEINPKIVHHALDLEIIENLPNKTGVYFFYNEVNQLIYIGKSKNIKSRVEQHLRNSKQEKGLRLIQEIARVEFELTGSETIALLRESHLVKFHKPKFNRALKNSNFSYGIFDELDLNGYIRLVIRSTSKSLTHPIIQFTSRKEASDFLDYVRSKYNLCEKYCGSKKVDNACFHYSIEECNGACLDAEMNDLYNERVQLFVDKLTFERKTFFILDKGRDKFEKSLVYIENGVFVGFGFAPYHFNNLEVSQWKKFIRLQQENRDDKTIINQALHRKPEIKIIEV